MVIETVTPQAVSLRISRAELDGRRTMTQQEAREAVLRALTDSGQPPWLRMEISLFPAEEELLLIARPVSPCPCRFRFQCFNDLTAALAYLPTETDSDVVYIEGGYELLLYLAESALPNALYEFGEPLPCTPELAAHLTEQGELIARENAVSLLQKYFC